MRTKGEVMARVRGQAMQALEKTASESGYGEVLQALAEEALKVAPDAQAVVVHPDDQEKLSGWALPRKLEVRTDPELGLGVRIVSHSGRTVENTLPERLHRAWDTLAADITRLLWE